MQEYSQRLADAIKKARLELGLTQEQVAEVDRKAVKTDSITESNVAASSSLQSSINKRKWRIDGASSLGAIEIHVQRNILEPVIPFQGATPFTEKM